MSEDMSISRKLHEDELEEDRIYTEKNKRIVTSNISLNQSEMREAKTILFEFNFLYDIIIKCMIEYMEEYLYYTIWPCETQWFASAFSESEIKYAYTKIQPHDFINLGDCEQDYFLQFCDEIHDILHTGDKRKIVTATVDVRVCDNRNDHKLWFIVASGLYYAFMKNGEAYEFASEGGNSRNFVHFHECS